MSKKGLVAILLAMALVAAACGGDDEADTTTTTQPTTTTTEATTTTTTTSTTTTTTSTTTTTVAAQPNLVEAAVAAGNFTTLLSLAQFAGLDAVLAAPGAFTVFAPTDDAFAKLPEGTVEALTADPEDTTAVAGILTYHAVVGLLDADAVVAQGTLPTVAGPTLTVTTDADGNVIVNDVAMVISANIETSNGIIHVIDTVLMPPTPEG